MKLLKRQVLLFFIIFLVSFSLYAITTPVSGTKTVTTAGTQLAMVATSTKVGSVVIQANPANTGYVYIGDSTVSSTNGIRLSAGEKLALSYDYVGVGQNTEIDLSTIYVDSSVNAEGIIFFYLSYK